MNRPLRVDVLRRELREATELFDVRRSSEQARRVAELLLACEREGCVLTLPNTEHEPIDAAQSGVFRGQLVEARYESRCRTCDGAVEIGEMVLWSQGQGVAHQKCGKAVAR